MDGSRRRRRLEATWVLGVVAYVIFRFVLAYSALAKYGRLNVVIFGVLDLVTAVPYAIGTARLVTSVVDHRPQTAARWGALAAGSFIAPYLWIAWIGRDGQFPTLVYVVVAVLVVCLGANAVLGVRRRVQLAKVDPGVIPADDDVRSA